ncbi:hypothetical protein F5Y05DRAFT_382520 [Hypoxylon sp. FL0543]|nr:hypothetical protein F5Y05DRAFT_382520 [Hypoxylon sp. FL0543]
MTVPELAGLVEGWAGASSLVAPGSTARLLGIWVFWTLVRASLFCCRVLSATIRRWFSQYLLFLSETVPPQVLHPLAFLRTQPASRQGWG